MEVIPANIDQVAGGRIQYAIACHRLCLVAETDQRQQPDDTRHGQEATNPFLHASLLFKLWL
jgi:hypothetical protein